MTDSIRVLICEDIEPILRRYKLILEKDKMIEVVGTASNGYDATLLAGILQPDVILMDVDMETHEAGIRATKQILNHIPDVSIVILSMYNDDELVFNAFQAGAIDYVLKDSPAEDVVAAVKSAYQKNTSLGPLITQKLRDEFVRVKTAHESLLFILNKLMLLTSAEMDVLRLLLEGKTRNEICNMRVVEMTTVKTQVRNILRKMDMPSSPEMIRTLKKLGLEQIILRCISNNGSDDSEPSKE